MFLFVSIYQSNNQSIDLLIRLSINQFIDLSVFQSVNRLITQSIIHSVNHSIYQFFNQSINNQSIHLSINQSKSKSINQFIKLSIYQSVNQSVNQIIPTLLGPFFPSLCCTNQPPSTPPMLFTCPHPTLEDPFRLLRVQLRGCSGAVQVSDACLGCSLSLCHFRSRRPAGVAIDRGRGNKAKTGLGQAFILLRRT